MSDADLKAKRQLAWACRRGMLELDILFERYFNGPYDMASNDEKAMFEQLLSCQDQDLFNWLCKNEACPHDELHSLIAKIKLTN